MKAVVFTLGCKVNESESEALIAGLAERGYEVSDKLVPADIYIVNTCAVTKEAEKKSRQTASRIRRLNKDAKIIFTGCAVQNDCKAFAEKGENVLATGVFGKDRILSMLDEVGANIFPATKEYEELPEVKTLKTRTYIKVQDGCDKFCSYCLIPYLRGRSRGRDPEKIIAEINAVRPKEAVINGIDLSSYNYKGITLTGLMQRLKGADTRIRLGSLEAGVIDEEFLSALKELKDFAPHFHLSLQSGSDEVLKKMNRRYTAEEFYGKVLMIRRYFKDAGITTDVIAGFPTETEEDFIKTVEFIKKAEFSDIHPFTYSPRKGTVAYKMKDLPFAVKKARTDELLKVKAELKKNFAENMAGKTLTLIVEEYKDGYTVGYSENYLRLYIKGEEKAETVKAKVIKPYLDGALAEKIGTF